MRADDNLKSLFTGLRTQQRKPPIAIRATSFAPERGNRYSYHLEDACSSFEDRSAVDAVQNNADTCVGVDTFKFQSLPDDLHRGDLSQRWLEHQVPD